jgi:hypothetical protein
MPFETHQYINTPQDISMGLVPTGAETYVMKLEDIIWDVM